MKKLFTLVALLAMVLGANAKTVVDTEIDYSTLDDWTQVAGGFSSDQAKARLSLDDGCLHFNSSEATTNFYDVQFQAFGVKSLDPDAEYTIEIRIKGSVAQDIRAYFSGSDAPGNIPLTTDWQVLTYKCKNNPNAEYFKNSGQVLIQCGDYIGEWWISNVKITHEEADGLVEEYVELLTNGDAEKAWADKEVRWNDDKKNFTICAWGKVREENMNPDGGWDPFPATIEEEKGNPSNHVFVVHAADAMTEGDAAAWDNQFWIEGPKAMKAGRKYKVSFRYKASQVIKAQTQIHNQNPSSYKTSTGLGEISFTEDWQTYDNTFIASDDHAGGWSFAFNLNSEKQNATDFYFDDLSWQELKVEEGFFVAPCVDGVPNLDQVVKFTEESGEFTATIGSAESPVTTIMISTVFGTPSLFKGGAIKPVTIDLESAVDYEEANGAVIKLPGKGAWDLCVLDNGKIEIIFVEGSGKLFEKLDIKPNPTHVVLKGLEREYLENNEAPEGYEFKKNEEGKNIVGYTWDNQFFIVANRALDKDEETVIQFKYKSSVDDAKVTTQVHGEPGSYIGGAWDAMTFQTTEQTFPEPTEESAFFEFKIPNDGVKTIAFNMAEIKEACNYEIYDIVWKLKDDTESLIDQTGTKNFLVKEGAGTNAYEFGTDPNATAISNVVVAKKNNSTVKFNLAGQRVSNDYKGIVVDGNGSKYIAK